MYCACLKTGFKKKTMKKTHFETDAVRTQTARTQHKEHSTPLYLTSGFVFDDSEEMRASFAEEKQRDLYSRYSNPNTSEFIDKICKMEGAEEGYAFASGMAAIYSTFSALLSAGDHIISARSVFGATHSLFTKYFPKWQIETSYFKVNEPETIADLLTELEIELAQRRFNYPAIFVNFLMLASGI